MNVLFYYNGFEGCREAMGGTSTMTFRLALACSSVHSTVLMGDRVKIHDSVENLAIVPTPRDKPLSETISAFDIVVFCNAPKTGEIEKQPSQVWIRHQHCWNVAAWDSKFHSSCDVIAGVSRKHEEHLKQVNFPPSVKIRHIPNCVDSSIFSRKSVDRDPDRLVYVGAISHVKGCDILISAFIKLRKRRPQVRLDMYGSASLVCSDDSFEKSLVDGALGLAIRFHGNVSKQKLSEAYSGASVLCLPSRLESFGLVSVEAQACGCVPVVSDVGGASVTVENGKSGFLYSPNTPEFLAATIDMALSKAGKMREAAMRNSQKFLMRETWLSFQKILEEVV